MEYARELLTGGIPSNPDAFYRLLAAGIIRQMAGGQPAFRCDLYQQYLQQHLA